MLPFGEAQWKVLGSPYHLFTTVCEFTVISKSKVKPKPCIDLAISMDQESRHCLDKSYSPGSLTRLQSKCWPGLNSCQGSTGARSTSTFTLWLLAGYKVPCGLLDRRPQFLDMLASPQGSSQQHSIRVLKFITLKQAKESKSIPARWK